jgi:hypothetical protein
MEKGEIYSIILFLLLIIPACYPEEGETVDFNLYNRTGYTIHIFDYLYNNEVDTIILLENDFYNMDLAEATGSVPHFPFAYSDSLKIVLHDSISILYIKDQGTDTIHKNPFCLNFYELVDQGYDHHFHRSVYEYSIFESDFN